MRRSRIAGSSRIARDEHRPLAGAQAADPGGSGLREYWAFLEWGPTTDNVLAHLVPAAGALCSPSSSGGPSTCNAAPGARAGSSRPRSAQTSWPGVLDYGIAALGGGPGSKRPAVTQGRSSLRAAGAVRPTTSTLTGPPPRLRQPYLGFTPGLVSSHRMILMIRPGRQALDGFRSAGTDTADIT